MENKSLLNNEYIVNNYHNIPQKKNENDIIKTKKTKKLYNNQDSINENNSCIFKNSFIREVLIKNENHKNSQKNSKIKSNFKLKKKISGLTLIKHKNIIEKRTIHNNNNNIYGTRKNKIYVKNWEKIILLVIYLSRLVILIFILKFSKIKFWFNNFF